jgi:hypothetical protein
MGCVCERKTKGEGKMKRLHKFTSVVAILGVVLLALPFQAFATPPEEVVFDFAFYFTGPDSAAGDFWAEGAIEDSGSGYEVFRYTDEGTLQGIKVLNGSQGTITLRFNLEIIPIDPTTARTDVHFVIQSGTDAYENIHGVGTGAAIVDFGAGTLIGTFSGTVHIDP